jgi:hypothetical protein
MDQHRDQTIVSPREARQGYRDRPVLLVLIVSLAAIVLLFGILWGMSVVG